MAKGKKGGKKGKKTDEKLSKHEALLLHQVNTQRKTNDDTTARIIELQHEKEMNQLKQETAHDQLEEEKKKLIYADRSDQKEAAYKQEVSNHEVSVERAKQVQLNKTLADKEESIIKEISEVESKIHQTTTCSENRKKFYNTEYVELSDKVKLLEKHLSEMILQFDEMKMNLESQVTAAKLQQDEKNNSCLEKQKENAIQYAIKRLPPHQSQELRENRWLLSEAAVHREQIKILYSQVENLERRNLDLMNVVYTKRMARLGMLIKSGNDNLDTMMNDRSALNSARSSKSPEIRKLSSTEAKDLLSKTIQDENLKHINNLAKTSSYGKFSQNTKMTGQDPDFSLHPSEIDLSLTNFKNIDDFNDDPARVSDFNGKIGEDKSGKLVLKDKLGYLIEMDQMRPTKS